MIRDIVFEENYAKRVEEINQAAFGQGFAQGRQTGWNEVFNIMMQLQAENKPLTQENVMSLINQMLVDQSQADKE